MYSKTFTVAVVAALALSVYSQDANVTMAGVDMDVNTTMAVVPPATDMPAMDNSTADVVMTNTTMMMMMTNATTTPDVQPVANETTTPATTVMTTTDMPPEITTSTTPSPCKTPTGRLEEVFQYTNTAEFTTLSANTQILVYEVLAAAEGCKMTSFITSETALRIFRMLGELPVRYVYIFIDYMAGALQNEGVVGPS